MSKWTMSQELRTLMAAMQSDSLPETVCVTAFMEGLRTGVARTKAFRVYSFTFKEAVSITQNAEHNFKTARLGLNGHNPSFARATLANTSAYCKTEPMYLGHAEDVGEAELQVAAQQQAVRHCYMCGSTKHLRPTCP